MIKPALMAVFAAVFAISYSAGADEAAKKELEKLSGTWELVSAQRAGKDATKEMKEGYKITFRANLWLTEFEGHRPFAEGDETIEVDPSKTPKQFVRVHKGVIGEGMKDRPFRVELPGIYEIDGDVLKLCWAVGGKDGRPKEFKTERGSEHLFLTLKKAKK